MRLRLAVWFLLLAWLALPATAQITRLSVPHTRGTTLGGQDVVANVIGIDFIGFYTGAQILIELSSGEVVNIPNVGDTAPSAFLTRLLPDYVFDTYIAQGAFIEDDGFGTPNLGGGAVNIGGRAEATAVFNDATKISQAFNPDGGADIRDQEDFIVARIGLTLDACGTFAFFASPVVNDVDHPFLFSNWPIMEGAIFWPEPAALGNWLAVAALGFRGKRRRLRSDRR